MGQKLLSERSISTALSAVSLQRNAMKDLTASFWITVKPSTRLLMLNIHDTATEVPVIDKKPRQSILIQIRPKQKNATNEVIIQSTNQSKT
jgi:hypothetical protein